MQRIAACVLAACMMLLFVPAAAQERLYPTELMEDVLDAGTFTELDLEAATGFLAGHYFQTDGMCTAVALVTGNGEMLVGRNMDLYISSKPAFVFRTKVPGCYETMGVMYSFRDYVPDTEVALADGLAPAFARTLPFLAGDVLNSEGLYIERNMRNAEFWPSGEDKFWCRGTHPGAPTRIFMSLLPAWLGAHCGSVNEALEQVDELDVYSVQGKWNYAFLMADAQGHYGVLEFADDRTIWHEGQPVQTNFYLDEISASIQELKSGLGRYETALAGLEDVQTETDLRELMEKLCYSLVYSPRKCGYEIWSECTGTLPWLTQDFVNDPANHELILGALEKLGEMTEDMARKDLERLAGYWETCYTAIVNCQERSIWLRFFEDDGRTMVMDFEDTDTEVVR